MPNEPPRGKWLMALWIALFAIAAVIELFAPAEAPPESSQGPTRKRE